ncbi:two-component sensor histidine kinase [Oerskovia sp. Sa1BUA8]|uniref:histidine kinase n=2 Tax=Oerskovia TaxID=162491 RepID=A0A9D5UC31_9CELL|nr:MULTISPECIES: histidine kinase [Oerskovia]MBD7981505.1 two-component sensor histidine kinase [Oerskovia merdavium]MBE7701594.1 two-component sensor histidine kinase [Oerskovia douganii]
MPDPLPTAADTEAETATHGAAPASRVRQVARRIDAGFRDDGPAGDPYDAAGTFLIGVALIAVGVVSVWSVSAFVQPESRWWHVVPLAVGCLILLAKRRHTALALAGGTLVVVADLMIGGSLSVLLVLWELLFACGLYGSKRLRTVVNVVVTLLVVAAAVATGEYFRDVQGFALGGIQAAAIIATPLWWAANVRQKTDLAVLSAERADLEAQRADLEAQRAADLEQIAELGQHEAVRAERAAMARDLHDVIASHLSAIAIHSGAALASPPDAARDRAALELVRSSSITSLEEMRAMILLLRSDLPRDSTTVHDAPHGTVLAGEAVAAPARLARLDDVLSSARAQGLTVEVQDPDGARSAHLSSAHDQAAHRIVQEALTNAAKHAPGSRVRVVLGLGEVLAVEVTSTLTASPGPLPASLSARTGLLTMRERAEALGGTFRAGPSDEGDAWTVRAELPLCGPPTSPSPTTRHDSPGASA